MRNDGGKLERWVSANESALIGASMIEVATRFSNWTLIPVIRPVLFAPEVIHA